MKPRRGYLGWLAFGFVMLLLRWAAGHFPHLTETVYSRGLFPLIRNMWDYSLGRLPIPLIYVLLGSVLVAVVWPFRKKKALGARLKASGKHLLGFIGGSVGFFFLLWGFHYARVPFCAQTQICPTQPSEALEILLQAETQRLNDLRTRLSFSDSLALPKEALVPSYNQLLQKALNGFLQRYDFPQAARVSAYPIWPKGWLIGMGATGIYLPWTGQGQYDAALHHLEQPVTAAHEMGHALGFTHEGVCNFLGYMACVESEDPVLMYAGQLSIWRALARSAYIQETALYHQAYGQLSAGIRADLAAIRERRDHYKSWFPRMSSRIYDQYLKGQGIDAGLAAYGEGVLYWQNYRRERARTSP